MSDIPDFGVVALVPVRTNPYRLNTNLAPVDWKRLRESIDPQGEHVPARDLVDCSFVIDEFRPVESTLSADPSIFYWCRCHDQDGKVFNTTLGGRAVVEVLELFDRLRAAYKDAQALGDTERVQQLEAVGANAPVALTLRFAAQGKYNGYYYLD